MSMPKLDIGLDVHKDSVMVAVLPQDVKEPTTVERLPSDFKKLRRFFTRLADGGEIHACYEANGAGYVLQRAMREWGYACEVVAPSLISMRPGDRRKHDRRDATQLARLYRAGELVPVRIPTERRIASRQRTRSRTRSSASGRASNRWQNRSLQARVSRCTTSSPSRPETWRRSRPR